jgi:phospholipid/cholesterol/gamma-HCH transport system substrate-binding protein
MKSLFRENIAEAITGLIVVVIAVWFFVFALERTGGGGRADALHVTALFPNATGISVGTDVRIAGLKVGTVSAVALDPQGWQAKVTLAIDPKIKVPADSSAAVSSEGLLGGSFLALLPGGETTPLKEGDEILDTQGAVDMMSLVGSFVNRSGGDTAKAGGNTSADSPTIAP